MRAFQIEYQTEDMLEMADKRVDEAEEVGNAHDEHGQDVGQLHPAVRFAEQLQQLRKGQVESRLASRLSPNWRKIKCASNASLYAVPPTWLHPHRLGGGGRPG